MPRRYQPPFQITSQALNLVAKISELLGRWSVMAWKTGTGEVKSFAGHSPFRQKKDQVHLLMKWAKFN